MTSKEIKALLVKTGWSSVDVAVYWGLSVTYLSGVINSRERGEKYNCAFRGLPQRGEVALVRKARHIRHSKSKKTVELNPKGRVLEALCSRYIEEGLRVVVVGSNFGTLPKPTCITVHLRQIETEDANGFEFELPNDEVTLRFGDTGIDVDV